LATNRSLLERIGDAFLGKRLTRLARLEESLETMLQLTGWTRSGEQSATRDFSPLSRKVALDNSRYYWTFDPKAGQAVRLYRDYVLGGGMTYTAPDPRVRDVIDAFWTSARNAPFTSYQAQQKLIERLAVEGELFLAQHTNRFTGDVVVRSLDPGEVDEVITAPGDDAWPLYYQRTWSERTWDYASRLWKSESTTKYYRDVNNADEAHDEMSDRGTEVQVLHVAINTLGTRGVPVLFRALPWVKAHKGFMEDRATITLALATFAFRQKVKGSKAAVDRLATTWDQTDILSRYNYGAAGGPERAAGARTLIENEAVTLEQLKTESGASSAYVDGRMLVHEICAATGIFEHYFGNPETGNLATATAMELPMLKMFESWQRIVAAVYEALFYLVVVKAIQYGALPGAVRKTDVGGVTLYVVEPGRGPDPESGATTDLDLGVHAAFPPIVQRDLGIYSAAITQALATGVFGNAIADPRYREAARLLLGAIGVPNPEAVIAQAEELAAETAEPEGLAPQVEALRALLQEVLDAARA